MIISHSDILKRATRTARVWGFALSIMALPLVLAGLLYAEAFEARMQERRLVDTQSAFVDLNEISIDIITELQRERGRTSAFLAGPNPQFAEELAKQRLQTDAVLDRTREDLNKIDFARLEKMINPVTVAGETTMAQRMAKVRSFIAVLPQKRQRIDALATGPDEMRDFYTDAIGALIRMAGQEAKAFSSDGAQRLGQLIGLMQQATEFAGLERAAGARGFGSGTFDADTVFEMVELRSAHMVLLSQFRSVAPERYRLALNEILQSDAAASLNRLRSQALANTGRSPDIASTWFTLATQQIDALNDLTQQVLQEQNLVLAARRQASDSMLQQAFWGGAGLALLCLMLTAWQIRLLLKPFETVAKDYRQYTSGEEPTRVIGRL